MGKDEGTKIGVECLQNNLTLMMVDPELLKERRDRILKAVALEKPDRIPMVLEYSGFAANATKTEIADFISSPSKATETMIQAYKLIGGGDCDQLWYFFAVSPVLSLRRKSEGARH